MASAVRCTGPHSACHPGVVLVDVVRQQDIGAVLRGFAHRKQPMKWPLSVLDLGFGNHWRSFEATVPARRAMPGASEQRDLEALAGVLPVRLAPRKDLVEITQDPSRPARVGKHREHARALPETELGLEEAGRRSRSCHVATTAGSTPELKRVRTAPSFARRRTPSATDRRTACPPARPSGVARRMPSFVLLQIEDRHLARSEAKRGALELLRVRLAHPALTRG